MKHSKISIKNVLTTVIKIVVVICVAIMPTSAQEPPIINLVYNNKLAAYQQLVSGFKSVLAKNNQQVNYVENIDYSAIASNTRLILALGSKAINHTQTKASNQAATADIIATLTLNTDLIASANNSTGIAIQVPSKRQLQWHQRILPDAKRIGVLYDPKNSQALVDELTIAAESMSLKIIAVAVHAPTELSAALKRLGREADSILSIPDNSVYSGKTAKAILLFAYRNKLPFVGMSRAWVKAGAIYALDWDYFQLGQQSGTIALDILAGKKAKAIAIQYPTSEQYLLNLKTAEQLKIDFSSNIINGASEVFQ
ncbi:putative ABC transport system substrate-binding protein [Colwellia chukchiensis]|uniref:Putative ABC transport system substrate-binding protein n=1 Tax=Colwellia chukchiensis TaxID=641665 RepID=A0A1H7MQ87_9GAMM|nr:ABC transporter substrate binding protein [Colwellia chukchiensis]SEL13496.1 putative ABC transport system substrate-binding protein [Colwellia chukchiensis]